MKLWIDRSPPTLHQQLATSNPIYAETLKVVGEIPDNIITQLSIDQHLRPAIQLVRSGAPKSRVRSILVENPPTHSLRLLQLAQRDLILKKRIGKARKEFAFKLDEEVLRRLPERYDFGDGISYFKPPRGSRLFVFEVVGNRLKPIKIHKIRRGPITVRDAVKIGDRFYPRYKITYDLKIGFNWFEIEETDQHTIFEIPMRWLMARWSLFNYKIENDQGIMGPRGPHNFVALLMWGRWP